MREIKFRAWDGEQMIAPCNLWDRDDSPIEWLNNLPYPDSILMQYTGLKDKNGKEIYERDLFWWNWLGSPILREVEFHNGCFIGRDIEHIVPMEHLGDFPLKEIEVIGNIYENPELLKETKG